MLANDLRRGGRAVIKLLDRGPGVTKNLEREILTHRRCGAWPSPTFAHGCVKRHGIVISLENWAGQRARARANR